jgi:hypothetical protein
VIVSGFFESSLDFGGGPLAQEGSGDAIVVRLDPSGGHVWSRRYGDGASQDAAAIAVDGAGDVVVGVNAGGTVDFGGGPIASAGSNDVMVVKLDAAGDLVWARRFGGAERQDVSSLAVDCDGNIVFTGSTTGPIDFGGGPIPYTADADVFVAKLDPKGDTLKSCGFGSSGDQRSTDVAVDPGGDIVITGYFEGSVDFGTGTLTSEGMTDAFLVELAP